MAKNTGMLVLLRNALKLDDDAPPAEIRAAVLRVVDQAEEEDQEGRDPRITLTKLAEKRAAAKKIGFVEALRELSEEQPGLTERVRSFYLSQK